METPESIGRTDVFTYSENTSNIARKSRNLLAKELMKCKLQTQMLCNFSSVYVSWNCRTRAFGYIYTSTQTRELELARSDRLVQNFTVEAVRNALYDFRRLIQVHQSVRFSLCVRVSYRFHQR